MKKLISISFTNFKAEFLPHSSLFDTRKIPLLLLLFFFSFFVNNLTAIAVPTSVRISLPLDRTVYQQNSSSAASFILAGQVQGYYSGQNTVEYQIERLDKSGTVISTYLNWTSLAISATGFYKQDINNLPTGWYKMSVRYLSSNTVSVKVGVGEVIFVAGQSNAQGISFNNTGTSIPNLGVNYDCLNAVNENCFCQKTYKFPEFKQMIFSSSDELSKVAPNGNQTLWAYQALGKRIVDRSSTVVTPVMFFNSGVGGTDIKNWYETAINENAITINPLTGNPNVSQTYPDGNVQNCQLGAFNWNSEGPEGHPYRGLRMGLNYYGSITGTRGVIWHQGESDTKLNTAQSYYNNALEAIIGKTREHYNSNLGWAISRVSRLKNPDNGNIVTSALVKAAQQSVKENNSIGNTKWGAYYSDEIIDRVDDTHFNSNGLLKLAELYDSGNFTGNTAGGIQGGDILSLTPVESIKSPTVTVTQSGTNVIITLNSAYSSYRWVKNEAKINTSTQTGQSITVGNTGTDRWRCYVLDNKGNVVISQEVALPIEQAIILGLEPCNGGTYIGRSDVINCNEISGWAFKPSTNTNSGVGTVDIFVDGVKTQRLYAQDYKPYYFIPPLIIQSYEGYFAFPAANASWKDGQNHTVAVGICETGVYFASATLNCPAPNILPPCQCGFTLITANQNAGQYSGSYTFNSCSASSHKWKLFDGTTEIANNGSTAYTVTSSTVNFNIPTSVNTGNYQFRVDADNCVGTGTQPFSYTKPNPNTDCNFTVSASSNPNSVSCGGTSQLTATCSGTGCSGVSYAWSGNSSNYNGSSVNVTLPNSNGTVGYTLTASKSGCSNQSANTSVSVSGCGGGGPCNYTDGQYLTTWFGDEVVNAYICGTKFYAKNNSGDFKSKSWLTGTGRFTTAELNCFEENDPRPAGCSGGGCTSPTPTISASSLTVPSILTVSGCSGTVNWSTGASGNSISVTAAGTYSANCTNPPCTVSGNGSITVTNSGGGCSYSNGQFLTEWFGNEIVRAYICGTKYYAKNDAGYFKSKSWLTGTGRFTQSELDCFEEVNPGCGGLRLAVIQSEQTDDNIAVHPNPTTGKIKIVFSLQKSENVWLNLYDVQGKSLDLRDFEGKIGRNEMEYDLQNYPSGAYFVNFQSSEKREVLKVIKVN